MNELINEDIQVINKWVVTDLAEKHFSRLHLVFRTYDSLSCGQTQLLTGPCDGPSGPHGNSQWRKI